MEAKGNLEPFFYLFETTFLLVMLFLVMLAHALEMVELLKKNLKW